jgi:hypothetical protein
VKIVTVVDSVNDHAKVPEEVMNDWRDAWADYELGNDWYYLPAECIITSNEEDGHYPYLASWLKETFEDPSAVLLHYWW